MKIYSVLYQLQNSSDLSDKYYKMFNIKLFMKIKFLIDAISIKRLDKIFDLFMMRLSLEMSQVGTILYLMGLNYIFGIYLL